MEPVRVKVDDALDGLAEELLLDERLPAKRTDLEPGAGFRPAGGRFRCVEFRDGKPAKPLGTAFGGDFWSRGSKSMYLIVFEPYMAFSY